MADFILHYNDVRQASLQVYYFFHSFDMKGLALAACVLIEYGVDGGAPAGDSYN